MNKHELPTDQNPGPDIRRVSFHTLGCKLNQAETAAIATQFRDQGIEIVPFRQPADLTYINTCTVTHTADAKSRQAIRQAVAASPGGRVVVAGCYSQINPAEAAALEGVDLILGAREKYQVMSLLTAMDRNRTDRPLVFVSGDDEVQAFDESPFISATSRTRAFLKVQEGCDYQCSYCIIPAARGRARSRPLADCLSEAAKLVAAGYRELVLTGVNIGTWRQGDREFADLLEKVSAIEGLHRLRISSIEPNLITQRLLDLMAQRENICPHLHVPLQHAADNILGAMRRRYKLADYQAVLERIIKTVPEAAVGADVIVGFPGETRADFDLLVASLGEMPLAYLHIFRYSERDGTLAASMAGVVPPAERKRRSAVLRSIGSSKRADFAGRFLNLPREVYFEGTPIDGFWEGLTDNYLRVRMAAEGTGQEPFRMVRLDQVDGDIIWGTPAA